MSIQGIGFIIKCGKHFCDFSARSIFDLSTPIPNSKGTTMSFGDNQYPTTTTWGAIADQAEPNERVDFIKKTYLHLLGAMIGVLRPGSTFISIPR